MKLKQIEIQGFKSFQKKTILKIDNNLIGIVGPNGSGKSNIIDAIRWVLGEQSAKNLRGSSMKDVIFSGTEEKKEKNFAEVSVVFSIEGQNKILTRRLYRNGDSEYLVDGKKSKLKELTDIFFDVGINKESYSIITQGKVEEILSSKPEDRRSIIEEAAGVLKYKNKKKEATSKLEKTNENLLRLNDIFSEIENRNNILSVQKEKAEQYIEYNNLIKNKDITLKIYDIKTVKNKYNLLNNENNELLHERTAILEKISTIDKNIENLKISISELDNQINDKKSSELELVTNREKLVSEVNVLIEKRNNKEENINKLLKDIEKINLLNTQIQLKISLLENDIFNNKKLLKNIDEDILSINNNTISIEEVDNNINLLKDEYINLVTKESKLENELLILTKEKSSNIKNIQLINDEISKLTHELNIIQSSLVDMKSVHKEFSIQEYSLLEQNNKLDGKVVKVSNDRERLLKEFSKENTIVQGLYNKKEFLNNQIKSFSNYNIGVKEILQYRSNIVGVHDVVGNVIKFDNKYSIALDIALSSSQQNIIVDNSSVAKKCVEYLKNNKKGRATFLPLNIIVPRNIDSQVYGRLQNSKGFIGVGSELVEYNSIYKNIVTNLLGTIIVAENLELGNEIAKSINYKYRIVTLDGQVINSGGSITGGSVFKNNNSIIKTNADLENINATILNVEKKIVSIQKLVDEKNIELEELNKEISKNNEEINIIQENIKNKDIEIKVLENNNINLSNMISNETIKLEQYSQHIDISATENKLMLELNKIKQEIVSANVKINELANQKSDIQKQLEESNSKLGNLNNEKSRLLENIKISTSQLEELKNNVEINVIEISTLENELNKINNSNFDTDIESNNKTIASYTNLLDKLHKELFLLTENKNNILKEDSALRAEYKQSNTILEEINNKLENNNLSLVKHEVKIDNAINYLVDTYNTTYEKEEQLYIDIPNEDISKLKKEVGELKTKITKLGNINLQAIDEFSEVNERYNFYKKEIDDLLESKEKLEYTISEIDKDVTDRFLNTFNKVVENFDRIYKSLFNGGYARIVLEDEKDILNTGVNIEVSPPGKKLQKLSLLSGGEKALTAISLLFAILEIKKSPFVILDEVEAALDDINVSRFANFLKYYSKENQFIIITHRRGTMEVMDKIYGVTMKEKGISYVLPLELSTLLEEDYINE